MAFILRKVRRASWLAATPQDPAIRQRALDDFRRSPDDTDGLSVYEVSTQEERDLVTAAFACSVGRVDTMDFLEIPREMVEQYGLIAETIGGMPIPAANALHRSLNWSPEILAAFAAAIFDARVPPVRRSKADVRASLARLDPDAVEGEQARTLVLAARTT